MVSWIWGLVSDMVAGVPKAWVEERRAHIFEEEEKAKRKVDVAVVGNKRSQEGMSRWGNDKSGEAQCSSSSVSTSASTSVTDTPINPLEVAKPKKSRWGSQATTTVTSSTEAPTSTDRESLPNKKRRTREEDDPDAA